MSQHRSYGRLQRVNPLASNELDRVFAYDLGGRGMVGYDGGLYSGDAYPLAPAPFVVRRRTWMAVAGSTTPLLDSFNNNVAGAAGARNITATSLLASMPRVAYTAATLNSSAGVRHGAAQFFRNEVDTANGGGFFMAARFAILPSGSGYRWWVGMAGTTASIGTTAPSAIVNAIGIGADSNDTEVQLMSNGATGVASEVSTQVGVATIASVPIDVVIHCARLSNRIGFAWRAVGGSWNSYSNVFAKAPAPGVVLSPQLHLNAGSMSSGASIDISSIFVETDA